MAQGLGFLDRFVAGWASRAARRPYVILSLFIILAILAGIVASTGLSVNTDTRRMLNQELDFQIWKQSLDTKFPMLEGGLVLVVRGKVEEEVDDALRGLVAGLQAFPEHLTGVFAPAIDPFLLTHGLLFLSRQEIEERLRAEVASATLIDNLAASQSLDTLFSALTLALEQSRLGLGSVRDLDPLLRELTDVIEAILNKEPAAFSWLRVAGYGAERNTAQNGPMPIQQLLYVEPIQDFTALQPAAKALDAIAASVNGLAPDIAERVEIGVTGEPALRTQELATVARGIELSFAISLVLVAGLLMLCFLSVLRSAYAFAALLTALLFTAGLAALFVGELNLVSVAFAVLLVGLGLDFAIHFLAHLEDGGGQRTVPEAVAEAGSGIGAALVMSAITTALAFLAFVPTNFVGMGQLGIIGALGVVTAFFVAITLLPALLALTPKRVLVARRPRTARSDKVGPNKLQFLIATAFCALVGYVAPQAMNARFETDPMALRDPMSPAMQTVDWLLEDPATSPYRISAVASSPDTAAAIKTRLSGNREVHSAVWLGDFVADDQDAKLELIARARALPSASEALDYGPRPIAVPRPRPEDLIRPSDDDFIIAETATSDDPTAQLIAALRAADLTQASSRFQAALERYRTDRTGEIQARLQEHVFRYLDNLVDLRGLQSRVAPYTLTDLPRPLVRRFLSEDGTYRIDIAPAGDMRDAADLTRFVAAVDTPGVVTAGGATEILRSGDTVSEAMKSASLFALALVVTVSLIFLRSIAMMLAIVVPLLIGALFTAALSGLFDVPFNYANVIVLPLLIGLGVDSGIHLAVRGHRLRSGEAIFETSTPRAILFSALTTIAAFGALSLSDHRGTASMGLMLAMALTCTIISVFILTPPLVYLASNMRGKNAADLS